MCDFQGFGVEQFKGRKGVTYRAWVRLAVERRGQRMPKVNVSTRPSQQEAKADLALLLAAATKEDLLRVAAIVPCRLNTLLLYDFINCCKVCFHFDMRKPRGGDRWRWRPL